MGWLVRAAGILVAGFFALLLAAAWIGVPLPAGDQDYFLPVAQVWAEGGGLRHPFFSPVPGNPDNLYHWHGWLMPVLHGLILPPGGYERALVPGVVLGFLSVLLWARVLRAGGAGLQLAALPVLACLATYQAGRPELPGSILLALLFLLPRGAGLRDAGAGVLIGLLGVTSPALGLAGGLLHALLLAEEGGRPGSVLLRLCLAAGLSAAVAAGLTAVVTGVPLPVWAEGIAAHAGLIAARTDSAALLHYALMQPRMPGIALGLVLFPAWIAVRLAGRGPGLWLAPAGLLLLWVWGLGLRIPPTIYNAAALIPVFLALWVRGAGPVPAAVPLGLAPAALAAVAALGGQGLTAAVGLGQGVRAEALRAALRALPVEAVAGTDSVAHAMIVREVLGDARTRHGPDAAFPIWRIDRQSYSGLTDPAAPGGRCLAVETFHHPGIAASWAKDWAFAIFRPCSGD